MLVFEDRGKPEYPEKTLSEQGREPTTNSTHILRRVRESNPGHIGGRPASIVYGIFVAVAMENGFSVFSPKLLNFLTKYSFSNMDQLLVNTATGILSDFSQEGQTIFTQF